MKKRGLVIQTKDIISINSLSYTISNTKILQDITLKVYAGDIVSIIGPNGSGKSSLIKLISGDVKPTRGSISIINKQIDNWDIIKLAQSRSILPQSNHLTFP
ncbi:MAG: heme ABC transporter ATP-binding protein, partial [Phycisphaerae bacterium]|nr:heme ABC transporter ATP-binding protein [Phycisphaerae bacterium]